MANPINHILVIRLSALGDAAMLTPVLRALKAQYKDVELTVLTKPFLQPVFREVEGVNVIAADVKNDHKGLLGMIRLSKELRKLGVDSVADCHNVLRTNIIKRLLFKRPFIQIDKGRKAKKNLVTGRKFKQLKSTHQRYADVFEKLGFSLDLSNPEFPANKEMSHKAKSLLGPVTDQMIGIAPFAAFEGKTYPLDLMEQVISELSHSVKVVLFGGGNTEIQFLDVIAKKYANVINLAGKLSLAEELDVISNLELMIGMDSGNAHLAAMYGVKTLTLWGVTHPYAGFYPFDQDPENALLADRNVYPKIPTSIYGNKWPEGYEKAMSTIKPEAVIKKAKYLITGNQTSS